MLKDIRKKCIICWNEFTPFNTVQKTCSFQCSKKHKSNVDKKYKLKIKEKLWYIPTTIYKHKCKICWKKFESKSKWQKFCWRDCFYQYSKNSRKWKWNPNYMSWKFVDWSNTKNRVEFNYKYREFQKNAKKIIERQKKEKWFTYCEICWNSNAYRYETHHIIYRSEKPKHKNLHNIKNLIRLCRECHIKIHKDKNTRYKYIKNRELNKLFEDSTLTTRYE